MNYLLLTPKLKHSEKHLEFYNELSDLLGDKLELFQYSNSLKKFKNRLKEADLLIFDLTFLDDESSLTLGFCYQNFRYKILLISDLKLIKNDPPIVTKNFDVFGYDLERRSASVRKLFSHINKLGDDRSNPRHVTLKYYEAIQKGRYEESWHYLHPDYTKEIWNNDYSHYLRGYKGITQSIQNIKISHLDANGGLDSNFLVTYIDWTKSMDVPDFKDFGKSRLGDLDRIKKKIENLKKDVIKKGYSDDAIDNLTLDQMSQSNNGVIIQYLLEKSTGFKQKIKIYDNDSTVRSLYSRQVFLKKFDDCWYIYKIKPWR